MLNLAFAQVLPGERWQRAPCVEGIGKWAHEKFSLLVATCMASMPPLTAHKDTLPYGKIGASLGREEKQGTDQKVAWFLAVDALKMS
jgi:hypothetical protein